MFSVPPPPEFAMAIPPALAMSVVPAVFPLMRLSVTSTVAPPPTEIAPPSTRKPVTVFPLTEEV
jgi:hypothetical protein